MPGVTARGPREIVTTTLQLQKVGGRQTSQPQPSAGPTEAADDTDDTEAWGEGGGGGEEAGSREGAGGEGRRV